MIEDNPPPTTHLIAQAHQTDTDISSESFAETTGRCAFCGADASGLPVDEGVNYDYFNDDPLMQADTGHVCQYCVYCMNADRALKQGHWIVTPDIYERISTADLPEALDALRMGEYDTPYALYITRDPILSQHSYLWVPTTQTTDILVCAYARQTVRIEWDTLDTLVDAIEKLRWHGFRLDDIRSGEPRVSDLASVGRNQYRDLDAVIDPYRRTPELELALTLSRAADDQDRDETQDGNATLGRFT